MNKEADGLLPIYTPPVPGHWRQCMPATLPDGHHSSSWLRTSSQVNMNSRAWPLLALALLLLLVPTCGGEEQVKKADGVGPAVAKVAAKLRKGAEEKINLVKRSLSHFLARRLTSGHPQQAQVHQAVGAPAADDLRTRTRREIHAFLDSLQPHQLVRLRRAVAMTKLKKQVKNNAKNLQAVPK